ncbi:translation initiation factor IF-2-like [Nycticebus coucang]|nr:translation initiation factor IF-2-like [Nycticebus coucang]
MEPRDGVSGAPEPSLGNPVAAASRGGSVGQRERPGGAGQCLEARPRPCPGFGPGSPPPDPLCRDRARCAGGRARRGLACPRRGGKLSWEKLGAAGARPRVGTGESSGAREGAGGRGETPETPGREVQTKRVMPPPCCPESRSDSEKG